MGTKCNVEGMNPMYKRILCLSKVELTQARGVRPMAMWDSVPVKNFVFPILCLQIGLVNDVLNNLLGFFNSDVDKLSTGEEVARNTLVILNQVIAKIWQKRQIWDVNDDVMLRRKAMQIKRLHATKESTPGIKYGLLITIPLAENFVKNKKEESKKISEEISQLLTRICM